MLRRYVCPWRIRGPIYGTHFPRFWDSHTNFRLNSYNSDFHAFWEGIRPERQLAFLGALRVLEGVARHLGGEARQGLGRLGLERTKARFILVHLDVDLEHGARAQALCAALGAGHPEQLLEGARRAADFWVAIHRAALAGEARP